MGEFDLLARLRERLPPDRGRVRLGFGDDAAITEPGGATVTSVDALVEGVHFDRATATLAQIGHKALATALSDLAAMGAEPGEAYLWLGVPPDLDQEGCLELLDGALSLASEAGAALIGGDTTRAPGLSLATTVVGHARRAGDFVRRAGARPGDRLVLTGELGGAAAGLELLRDLAGAGLDPPVAAALRRRQLQPLPRLEAGLALARCGARAMIDLSDGLGADAGHLAAASAVDLEIDLDRVPIQAGVAAVATAAGQSLDRLAFAGGEDYELLAAIPAASVAAAIEACAGLGVDLSEVGEVGGPAREGSAGAALLLRPGAEPLRPSGYDQLAG